MVCVWKLKGFRDPPPADLPIEPSGKLRLVGEFNEFIAEFRDALIEPSLALPGEASSTGDSVLGSKKMEDRTVRGMPLIPRPASSSSSGRGVGGVGVRGGRGMGRLEAISASKQSEESWEYLRMLYGAGAISVRLFKAPKH